MRTEKIVGHLYDTPSKTYHSVQFVTKIVINVAAELEFLKYLQTQFG